MMAKIKQIWNKRSTQFNSADFMNFRIILLYYFLACFSKPFSTHNNTMLYHNTILLHTNTIRIMEHLPAHVIYNVNMLDIVDKWLLKNNIAGLDLMPSRRRPQVLSPTIDTRWRPSQMFMQFRWVAGLSKYDWNYSYEL